MSTSLIYQSPLLYEAVMTVLYGRFYNERYEAIAELIPKRASVLDVCCGPAILFHRYLKKKEVTYTGIDLNTRFIDELNENGARGLSLDITHAAELPEADYVVMQASLYHFLPEVQPIIAKLQAAARTKVIIAEPVRNLADSKFPLVAQLAARMTNPGSGSQPLRFNPKNFDALAEQYAHSGELLTLQSIANGREKLMTLQPVRPPVRQAVCV